MNKRLLSVGLLVVTLATGFGLGRALGTDDTPPTSTTSTTDPESAPPTTQPIVKTTDPPEEAETLAPVLAELVPELSHPLLLETTNPTRLLRWSLSDAEPGPVTGLPPGYDLTMDRGARYILTTISTGTSDVLVGGLLDTPLSVFSEDVATTPTWADFTYYFWFIQGDYLVKMSPPGVATHFELPQVPASSAGARATIALADDDGAVVEFLAEEERSSLVVSRVLVQSTGMIELPTDEGSAVVGMNGETILIRGPRSLLTMVDRATGSINPRYDGSCGPTPTNGAGIMASICNRVVSVHLEEMIVHHGNWTAGRWSWSGRWFMAVGGDSYGRVLLVDTQTREVTVLEVSLPLGSSLVDIWSGA